MKSRSRNRKFTVFYFKHVPKTTSAGSQYPDGQTNTPSFYDQFQTAE